MAVNSYTSLKQFENCQRQYHEVRVLKKFPYVQTPEAEFGDRAHKALELCGRDGIPLPPEFSPYQWAIDHLVRQLPGTLYFEHEYSLGKTGSPVDKRDWSKKFWMGKADVLAIDGNVAYNIDWKGFPLDTLVPTPKGFVRMGDIRTGDKVFGPDGAPCNVVGKSSVRNRPYHIKLTFEDGASVVCDDDHLWKLDDGSVVRADELPLRARIPLPSPAVYPHTHLPVDPYVLGLWLADGKHTSGEISKPDQFVWDEIQRRGYTVNMRTGGSKPCPTRTVKGLAAQLRIIGVLGDKYIPDVYLTASREQRLDLLRGLMDGDGYANPTRKQCQFTNLNAHLIAGVRQLVCSLGMRPYVPEVRYSGFNKRGSHTPVSFTPRFDNPFLLPRKAEVVANTGMLNKGKRLAWRSETRIITSIEEVPAVPSQCISVDSADNTYLVTQDYLVTHNTGSSRYPDTDQLDLMAMFTMMEFPAVDEVRGMLVFLQDAVTAPSNGPHVTRRNQMHMLTQKFFAVTNAIDFAHTSGSWKENPTPLCPWCPVTNCPNWKPKPEKRK